jgi:flagellar FliJ protein
MGKRFRWRFETVKKAREYEEDRRKEMLAEAQKSLDDTEKELARLKGLRAEQTNRMRSRQSGKLDTADLSAAHAYIQSLGQKIKAQARKVEQARKAVDARRDDLVESVKENKVLENLRERDRKTFRKEEHKKDQAAMDETANRRAARNRDQP